MIHACATSCNYSTLLLCNSSVLLLRGQYCITAKLKASICFDKPCDAHASEAIWVLDMQNFIAILSERIAHQCRMGNWIGFCRYVVAPWAYMTEGRVHPYSLFKVLKNLPIPKILLKRHNKANMCILWDFGPISRLYPPAQILPHLWSLGFKT